MAGGFTRYLTDAGDLGGVAGTVSIGGQRYKRNVASTTVEFRINVLSNNFGIGKNVTVNLLKNTVATGIGYVVMGADPPGPHHVGPVPLVMAPGDDYDFVLTSDVAFPGTLVLSIAIDFIP